MKIAIFSPYLDTAGGGEKYMLSLAQVLSEKYSVDILLDEHLEEIGKDQILNQNIKLHDLDLSKVNFKKAPIGKGSSFFSRLGFFKQYDYLFYLTDGSIFFATAKNNIIHFQVPFEKTVTNNIWGQIKLKTWNKAIYNSKFTKNIIEENWPIKGSVVYPPVEISAFKPKKKKKQIISVGRFFSYSNPKKQDLMIDVFKQMVEDKKLDGWSFHLAGGADNGNKEFLEKLEGSAKGYEIFLYPNLAFEKLIDLYAESAIYWHATGYGETDPKNFEHFGITTVEAMASGCIPVVIAKGGQTEIVEDKKSGFLWDDIVQWKEKTLELVEDQKKMVKMSIQAIQRSKEFSFDKFKGNILKLTE